MHRILGPSQGEVARSRGFEFQRDGAADLDPRRKPGARCQDQPGLFGGISIVQGQSENSRGPGQNRKSPLETYDEARNDWRRKSPNEALE